MLTKLSSRLSLAGALLVAASLGAFACGDSNASTAASSGSGGATTVSSSVASSASSSSSGAGGSGGSGGGGGQGGDKGHPSDVYPAFKPVPPTISKINGGPILAAPRAVAVSFAGDDMTLLGKFNDFIQGVGASSYWSQTTSEYGVAPLVPLPPVVLPDVAPATQDDATLAAWLAAKLNANDPLLPAADGSTIYVLTMPPGAVVTFESQVSCKTFGGYHSSTRLDVNHQTKVVPYVVVARCPNYKGFGPLDALTGIASHELVETALDPMPYETPGYRVLDGAHAYWIWATGGEASDMCSQESDPYSKFPGFDFNVARSWSNATALALHDPCVPHVGTDAYFNAAPVLPDVHKFSILGVTNQASVVKIPVGQSRDVELDLFSDAPTAGPWTVTVDDFASAYGFPAELSIALDRDSGRNGEKIYATITAVTKASGARGSMSFFLVQSKLGTQRTFWVGAVANK